MACPVSACGLTGRMTSRGWNGLLRERAVVFGKWGTVLLPIRENAFDDRRGGREVAGQSRENGISQPHEVRGLCTSFPWSLLFIYSLHILLIICDFHMIHPDHT